MVLALAGYWMLQAQIMCEVWPAAHFSPQPLRCSGHRLSPMCQPSWCACCASGSCALELAVMASHSLNHTGPGSLGITWHCWHTWYSWHTWQWYTWHWWHHWHRIHWHSRHTRMADTLARVHDSCTSGTGLGTEICSWPPLTQNLSLERPVAVECQLHVQVLRGLA